MGILILSVRDIIMKVLFVLCAVSANAVPNTCHALDNLIKKLAKEASSHYPTDVHVRGECSDGEGFACVGTILQTVWDCVSISANPLAILACVQEIIGLGNACYDCICWVMSYIGYNCPEIV